MIFPILAPNIDFKTFQKVCEKTLAVDPLSPTEMRGYKSDDLRVWINAFRMSHDYFIEDPAVQDMLPLGYLVQSNEYNLSRIGCFVTGNIKKNLGMFVGTLDKWQKCLLCLMVEETEDDLKEDLFLIYNHLCFLKLDYLFAGYKIKGKFFIKA